MRVSRPATTGGGSLSRRSTAFAARGPALAAVRSSGVHGCRPRSTARQRRAHRRAWPQSRRRGAARPARRWLEFSLLTRQPPRVITGSSIMLQARSLPGSAGARAPSRHPRDAGACARRAPHRQQRTVSRISAMICSGWVFSSRRTSWRAMRPRASPAAQHALVDFGERRASISSMRLMPLHRRADRFSCPAVPAHGRDARVASGRETLSQASRSSSVQVFTRRRLPITGPLTCGNAQAIPWRRPQTYSSPPLPPSCMLAFVRHAARGHQDFLLRRFHFAQLDRALGLEVVLQHLGGAFRHVLEELGLQLLAGGLQAR
jgi:hypothetical protein